jgi:hypothetical protein
MSYLNIQNLFNSFCKGKSKTVNRLEDVKQMLLILNVNLDQLELESTKTKYSYAQFLDLIKTQISKSKSSSTLGTCSKIKIEELVTELNTLDKGTTNYLVKDVFNINKKTKIVDVSILDQKLNDTKNFNV